MRRGFWVALFLVGIGALLVRLGVLERPITAFRLILEEPAKKLPMPIDGLASVALRDTWGAARAGGRRHEGIDIFAPRGTPVKSTTDGLIVRRGQNKLGGNVVWIFGPGRQMHYYAHLERFGVLEAGDLVSAGDIVGYVGNSGNARGTPPHLHYGVYTPGAGAINPFPLLKNDQSVSQTRRSPRLHDAPAAIPF
jgi:murein DD-endopeptidase MepM/ murein hydrolase activator NlpD